MGIQTMGSPFTPLGGGYYAGNDTVITLNTVPTDTATGGLTLAQVETALNAADLATSTGMLQGTSSVMVHSLIFGLVGTGTMMLAPDSRTPTVDIGIPYAAGVYYLENDPLLIHAFEVWLPATLKLNVVYGR